MICRTLIIILAGFLLTACQNKELLKGLTQQQANEVVAAMQRSNINVDKIDYGKDGFSIKVSASDFVAAVDQLDIYHLPTAPRMEIMQMFPPNSLVSSPRAEKARLYSAIEQRLEQAVDIMNGVVSSRVQISYDAGLDNNSVQHATHVAAVVIYNEEVTPTVLINEVKRFLKNSFTDIDYDSISVVLSKRKALQYAPPSSKATDSQNLSWLLGLCAGILVLGLGVIVAFRWRAEKKREVSSDEAASKENEA